MFDNLSPHLVATVVGVLGILSGVRVLLDHFLPKDSKFASVVGKIVDFLSANVKH